MPTTARKERIPTRRYIHTYVPNHVSLVSTPHFWIYVFCGLILAVVIATRFGLVPDTGSARQTDLNERPDPAVAAQQRKWSPAPEAAPVDASAAAPVGLSSPKLVRTFEPPPDAAQFRPAPKPAMPSAPEPVAAAEPSAPVEHVQPPVDHSVLAKPAEPAPTSTAKPDETPATEPAPAPPDPK